MSNYVPFQYAPIKHFTPIPLSNQSRNFPRPIYKPPPLNNNNIIPRPALGQGLGNEFIPTALTVPQVTQFNSPVVPNNPMNIS